MNKKYWYSSPSTVPSVGAAFINTLAVFQSPHIHLEKEILKNGKWVSILCKIEGLEQNGDFSFEFSSCYKKFVSEIGEIACINV